MQHFSTYWKLVFCIYCCQHFPEAGKKTAILSEMKGSKLKIIQQLIRNGFTISYRHNGVKVTNTRLLVLTVRAAAGWCSR